MTADALPAVAPAHTDWLYHHLTVTGPDPVLTDFATAASGAGVIPWHLDLDRLEEDALLRVMTAPGRPLSLKGARMLAGDLRAAVGRRHALAVAHVGQSRACPLDLHSLLPVPGDILRLGPDHPEALAWLWVHWGTTEALRHVVRRGDGREAGLRVGFWSADWSPWRALATLRERWPTLRFELQPVYDRP